MRHEQSGPTHTSRELGHQLPEYPTINTVLAKVIKIYRDNNTVDVVASSGEPYRRVPIMYPTAGTRTGEIYLPKFSATGLQNTGVGPIAPFVDDRDRSIFVVLGFLGDSVRTPVVLGFILPGSTQMIFNREGFSVNRHESDTYTMLENGLSNTYDPRTDTTIPNWEWYHSSGFFARVGQGTAHEDLTSKDMQHKWRVRGTANANTPMRTAGPDTSDYVPITIKHPSGTGVTIDNAGILNIQTGPTGHAQVNGCFILNSCNILAGPNITITDGPGDQVTIGAPLLGNLDWRGDWDNRTAYDLDDVVGDENGYWLCILPTTVPPVHADYLSLVHSGSPLAYYPLDNGTAYDATGHGYDGNSYPAPQVVDDNTNTPPIGGNTALFHFGDYLAGIFLPNTVGFPLNGSMSVEGWMYSTVHTQGSTAGSNIINWGAVNGVEPVRGVFVDVSTSAYSKLITAPEIWDWDSGFLNQHWWSVGSYEGPQLAWHHFALIVDVSHSLTAIYMDGVKLSSSTYVVQDFTGNPGPSVDGWIGAYIPPNFRGLWSGNLASLAVYDRPLANSEVVSHATFSVVNPHPKIDSTHWRPLVEVATETNQGTLEVDRTVLSGFPIAYTKYGLLQPPPLDHTKALMQFGTSPSSFDGSSLFHFDSTPGFFQSTYIGMSASNVNYIYCQVEQGGDFGGTVFYVNSWGQMVLRNPPSGASPLFSVVAPNNGFIPSNATSYTTKMGANYVLAQGDADNILTPGFMLSMLGSSPNLFTAGVQGEDIHHAAFTIGAITGDTDAPAPAWIMPSASPMVYNPAAQIYLDQTDGSVHLRVWPGGPGDAGGHFGGIPDQYFHFKEALTVRPTQNIELTKTISKVNNLALTSGQLLIGNSTTGSFDVATLTAGANVTITNAPGSITIASTGGGGGGGGGAISAVYHSGSRSTQTYSSDPTSDTVIPNMTVTFSLSGASTVRILASAISKKDDSGAGDRVMVRDNGTGISPSSGGSTAWIPLNKIPSEAGGSQQLMLMTLADLSSGSHTIDLVWQASGSTAAVHWYDRWLTVDVLT